METELQKHLIKLRPVVSALLTINEAFGDEDIPTDWTSRWSWETPYIILSAHGDEHARKIAGKLIRAFKKNPITRKVTDATLNAVFLLDGVEVRIEGYKPKTCRYEDVDVFIPAKPARTVIVEAVEAHVEKKRVLVCDEARAFVNEQDPKEVEGAGSPKIELPEIPF